MKIVVYTAIYGNIDKLWSVYPLARGDAEHVCFSDKKLREVGIWGDNGRLMPGTGNTTAPQTWEVRVAKQSRSPRKSARYYKTLAHEHFPDADVTIWLDGNVRLLIPPWLAVKKWLRSSNLATFNHPDRKCLFDEAAFCAKVGKANGAVLRDQVERYRKAGMPAKWGLPETRCVIRRKATQINRLNDLWLAEIDKYSPRDQVSLPFLCWKQGITWATIPGRAWVKGGNKDFYLIKHKANP